MNHVVAMTDELFIAAAMMAATVFFHAMIISAIATVFRATSSRLWGPMRFVRDSVVLSIESIVLLLAHVAEAIAWAFLLVNLGAFAGFEEAFYFAGVAFTTLGFGDVLLPQEWRLLAPAMAANGLLLFGLSAAFLLESASRLRIGDEHLP
jgi:hypothetical protein